MLWFVFALLTAFFHATANALVKRFLLKKVNEYLVMWVRWAAAVPFLFIILFFIEIPQLSPSFWWILLITLPLEITALILYVKALKESPLSLTIPFLGLTPVFLIATSFILLGEIPNTAGIIGILLVVSGAYLLNAHTIKGGLLQPLKAVTKERGSVLMIIVAFIFSFTSNLGKILIQKSSPLFFSWFYILAFSVVFSPIALTKAKSYFKQLKTNKRLILVMGIVAALAAISHMLAISLTLVPYAISVKRTSMIFSVLYGYFIFREKNIRERLLGSIVMLIGVALITTFG
jgi:drug/metabolite transporter (DMT)-like permease